MLGYMADRIYLQYCTWDNVGEVICKGINFREIQILWFCGSLSMKIPNIFIHCVKVINQTPPKPMKSSNHKNFNLQK